MPLSLNSKESLASCRDVQALFGRGKKKLPFARFVPLCFLRMSPDFGKKPAFIAAQRDLLTRRPIDYAPSDRRPRTILMTFLGSTDLSTTTLKNGNIISSQVMSP
jgi:hypothetical protein